MLRFVGRSAAPRRLARRCCRCATPALGRECGTRPVGRCQFPSGLVLVHEQRDCPNACVAVAFDAGSRHETAQENGAAHFFEHLCFRGTRQRSKLHVECEMNAIGGKFKCHTAREMVAFSAECLAEDVPQALDLLTDCIFDNALADSEVELQKSVVYREMLARDRDTRAVLFDYLHGVAFQGTPLAQSVMGPSQNLYNFSPATIAGYVEKMLVPPRMVFSCVGPMKQEQACNWANSYLDRRLPDAALPRRYRYTAGDVRYRDDSLRVAHVGLALEAPPSGHADYLPMLLAATALGAWDRAQPGAAHAAPLARAGAAGAYHAYEAFYAAYSDAGLWGVHFVAPRAQVGNAVEILQREWMRLCTSLTDSELVTAKQQLKWRLLADGATAEGACMVNAAGGFRGASAPTLRERLGAVDALGAAAVRRACRAYVHDRCPALAALGATEALPPLTQLRAGMRRLRD